MVHKRCVRTVRYCDRQPAVNKHPNQAHTLVIITCPPDLHQNVTLSRNTDRHQKMSGICVYVANMLAINRLEHAFGGGGGGGRMTSPVAQERIVT